MSSVDLRLWCDRGLTAIDVLHWLGLVERTFGTLHVRVCAKRKETGEVYLQVMGEVEQE